MPTSRRSRHIATVDATIRGLSTLVIVPMLLLAVVVPNVSGIVSESFEESHLPSESEEEREEAREEGVVSSERRFRSPPSQRIWASDWFNRHQSARPSLDSKRISFAGHRLYYDLLAPMTC